MAPLNLGRQPAHRLITEGRGVNIRWLARQYDISYTHLIGCLTGRVVPSKRVITVVTNFLDLPASACFTKEALSRTYRRPKNSAVGEYR